MIQQTSEPESGQTTSSAEKNATFFLDGHQRYRTQVASIDTYFSISSALSEELKGVARLLDLGNGGVFDYDTSCAEEIVGLDLFLDRLPGGLPLPANVRMVQGSALDIPRTLCGFDGVVMVMLLHHLVGRTVSACLANVIQAISEAHRVLRAGGRLVIMESCVPTWFYGFERMAFGPASFVIERTMKHPATLQYPSHVLLEIIDRAGFVDVSSRNIPLGKYVLQFGVKVPTWLTPVQPVLFSAVRP